MKINLKINGKMVVYVLGTALVVYLSTLGYIAFDLKNTSAENSIETYKAMAFNQARLIEKQLNESVNITNITANTFAFYNDIPTSERAVYMSKTLEGILQNNEHISSIGSLWESNVINEDGSVYAPYFVNNNGTISLSDKNANHFISANYILAREQYRFIISDPFIDPLTNKNSTQVVAPIFYQNEFKGAVSINIPLHFDEHTNSENSENLNEVILLITNNNTIAISTDTTITDKQLADIAPQMEKKEQITSKIKQGITSEFVSKLPNNNKKYYCIFEPIIIKNADVFWSFAFCIPNQTINAKAYRTFGLTILIGFIGLFILSIVLISISRTITNPLIKTNALMGKLVLGDISSKVNKKSWINDELVDIGQNIDQLIDGLNSASDFATQIGNGNLDVKYQLLSNNDMLGSALIKMQESLKEAKINEDLKKIEDEKRNWVTHGLAKFGEIIREDNSDIEKFSQNVIKHLLEYIDGAQGAIYIEKQDEYNEYDKTTYELKAAMAYGKIIMLNHTVEKGQELIGRAASENKLIYLKDIPEDFALFSPGMKNKARPNHVLVSPMSINQDIYGIIELLSYHEFETHQIEFIEKLSENIASVISSVNINANTAKLLEQSRQQADELAQHEEEMRQNLEEMQATQEEALKRQNKLTSHLKGLQSNLLTAELDMQGRIMNISPSMSAQYNISIDNIKGKFYEALVTNDEKSRNEFSEFWIKLMDTQSGKRIQKIEGRGKENFYLESYKLIQKEGISPRILIVAQDKSREKQLSDRIKAEIKHS